MMMHSNVLFSFLFGYFGVAVRSTQTVHGGHCCCCRRRLKCNQLHDRLLDTFELVAWPCVLVRVIVAIGIECNREQNRVNAIRYHLAMNV